MMTEAKSRDSLHPTEITHHILTMLAGNALSWVLIGMAMLLLTCQFMSNKNAWLRSGLMAGCLLSAIGARVSRSIVVSSSRIERDYRDISDSQRQQRLYELMKPQAELVNSPGANDKPYEPDRLWRWALFQEKPNKYPHVVLLAATGEGKTTLAEWLMNLFGGQKIVLHPHYQEGSNDFSSADAILGAGRDYKVIGAFIADLVQEMDDRYKLTKQQLESKPWLTIVVDEVPAVAKNCDTFSSNLITLISEARKVRIRLIILLQADGVKVLGIEGQGDMRESLAYVRMGSFAIRYAQELVNKTQAEKGLIKWLKQFEDYPAPCMVEDLPAIIPDFSLALHQPIAAAPTAIEGQSAEPAANHQADPVRWLNRCWDAEPGESEPDVSRFTVEDLTLQQAQNRIAELRTAGLNQTQIIFILWRAKRGGGKTYQDALAQYKLITGDDEESLN